MIQDTVPILGRKGPVSVQWGRQSPRGSISFLTLEDSERRQFLKIIEFPVIMFAARNQFGYDDPVFLSLETVTEERTIGYGGETSRRWVCDVQEVDRPPATYVPPVLANAGGRTFSAATPLAGGQEHRTQLVPDRRIPMIAPPHPLYLEQIRYAHKGHLRVRLMDTAGANLGTLPVNSVQFDLDGLAQIRRSATLAIGEDFWDTRSRDTWRTSRCGTA